LKPLSEEALIRWIEGLGWPKHPFLAQGIGDDCAICTPAAGRQLVVTTDLLVEGRHFLLETTPPRDLGWKTGAANLSDIAAMGAEPVAFFLSAALPATSQPAFQELMAGLHDILGRYGTPLAGGDLSAADRLFLSATVLGEVPAGQALGRAGARPGDRIYLTGQPGGSGGGLRLLTAGWRKGADGTLSDPDGRPVPPAGLPWACLEKHLRPVPRLETGRFLRESGAVTAAIDTSDGIAKDLRMIAAASGVGARLDAAALEKLTCGEMVTLADVLGGGEDYELLFTVDPAREPDFLAAYSGAAGGLPPLHALGATCPEHPGEIRLSASDGERMLPVSGWDHFSK